jgi:hypothetical protein
MTTIAIIGLIVILAALADAFLTLRRLELHIAARLASDRAALRTGRIE